MKPLVLSAALLFAALALAQDTFDSSELNLKMSVYFPRSQVTFSSDVKLVEAAVVARDNKGQTVAGLTKSDFEIRDAGKKREIVSFAVQSRVPLNSSVAPRTPGVAEPPPPQVRQRFVAILIDDLNSAFPEFRLSQLAAIQFVKEGLSAGDRAGIFSTFGQQINPFTTNTAQLVDALSRMRFRGRGFGTTGCPRLSAYESYLIANNLDQNLFNVKVNETRRCLNLPPPPPAGRGRGGPPPPDAAAAIVNSSARALWMEVRANSVTTFDAIRGIIDAMAPFDGSKMILLASGGFIADSLDQHEQERAIDHALRAGVVINSIDAKGLYTIMPEMPPGGDAQSIIQQQATLSTAMLASDDGMAILANSTGGKFIHNTNDLEGGLRNLGTLPEITYLLGFQPGEEPDGKYHKLAVQLTGSQKYSLQTRPGYIALKEPPPVQVQRKIDNELMNFTSQTELPASLTVSEIPNQPGKRKAVIHLNLAQAGLVLRNGVQSQKIEFIVALINDRNDFVIGKEGVLELSVKDSNYQRLAGKGLNFDVELDATPGSYRLRAVLQEANTGRFTSLNRMVDIQ